MTSISRRVGQRPHQNAAVATRGPKRSEPLQARWRARDVSDFTAATRPPVSLHVAPAPDLGVRADSAQTVKNQPLYDWLQAHPNVKTVQDFINLTYPKGEYEKTAKALGLDPADLAKYRAAKLTDWALTPPPPSGPVATSVEQANASFVSQWGGTPYNAASGAPAGYSDCGPTSCVMVLSQLGLMEHPTAAGAEDAIGAMRDDAVGSHTTTSRDTTDAQLTAALEKHGASVTVLKPLSTSAVDDALAAGHPLILGTGTSWAAWGKDTAAAGNYLNSGNPGGHYVTILGRTPEGKYLIGDPLSKTGTLEVTKEQLQKAIDGAWSGALEVSKTPEV